MGKEIKIEMAEKTDDGIYIFRIGGTVGVEGAAGIQGLLDACVRERAYRVVIDLEGVNFISSAGMGAFLSAVGQLRKNDGDMIFVRMQDRIMGVFRTLDVLDYFIVAEDVPQALERFRSGALPKMQSIEELTALTDALAEDTSGPPRALFSLCAAYADIFDGDADISTRLTQVVDVTANFLALRQCAIIPLSNDLGLAATSARGDIAPPSPAVAAALIGALTGKDVVAVEQFKGINRQLADWFARAEAHFLYPLFKSDKTPVAILIVGDKKDGQAILADERRVLRYLRACINLALRAQDDGSQKGTRPAAPTQKQFERKLMEMDTLFTASQELAAALETEKMLPTFLMMLTGQFSTDRALVLLEKADGGFELRGARGLDVGDPNRFALPAAGLAQRLAADPEPAALSVLSVAADDEERLQLVPFMDNGVAVLAPMRFKGKLIGIAGLGVKLSGKDFDAEETRLFGALANLAAVSTETARLLEKVKQTYSGMVRALISAIEAKDKYTLGHTERVTRYSAVLATALGMDDDAVQNIRFGAVLHDIGYLGVSEKILQSSQTLTPDEAAELRKHPIIGTNIIKNIPLLEKALDIVRHHHEAYDGSGYPDGLAGDKIPLTARILAVADAFDAMTSKRRYRDAKTKKEALTEIQTQTGKQFDPVIVKAFVRLCDEGVLDIIATRG